MSIFIPTPPLIHPTPRESWLKTRAARLSLRLETHAIDH